MDLFIRSQDKTDLFKINRLKIREHSFENGEKEYFILNNNSMSDVVGIYKQKERALEVLDEIQKILNAFKRNDGKNGNYENLDLSIKVNMLNYVYEMPKE